MALSELFERNIKKVVSEKHLLYCGFSTALTFDNFGRFTN